MQAERLADGPSQAYGTARCLIRSAMLDGFDAHLDREAEAIVRMAVTTEAGDLIAAFLSGDEAW